MVRLALTATLALLSQQAIAIGDFGCSQSPNDGFFEKFTFEVTERARAPTEDVAFRYCQGRDSAFLLVRVTKKGQSRKMSLDAEQSKRLLALYEAALDANFKDEDIGLDGASWCLQTNRGSNNLRACFWSPAVSTQRRGLDGFAALGAKLWDLAGLDKSMLD